MKKYFLPILLSFLPFIDFAQSNATKELWGVTGQNTIFKTDTGFTQLQRVYDFSANNGGLPEKGKFVEATNGKLYALSTGRFAGTIIELDPKTEEQRIVFGLDQLPGFSSYRPQGSLIQAADGKLYGLTSSGAAAFGGIIFSYDIQEDTLILLKELNQFRVRSPEGDLLEASNGKLYGMSRSGGTNNAGTIFEYDIALDTIVRLHDFDDNNGASPKGSLIQVGSDKLIGMTTFGGPNNHGVIFEYDFIDDSYTKLYDLDSTNSGRHPSGSLVEADNGFLYAMTLRGGAKDAGVIFEFDLATNSARKIVDLDSAAYGDSPEGDLMQASDGMLYGMCRDGGFLNDGTLLQVDPTNDSVRVLFEFGDENGQFPRGSVIQASNGFLYGMTLEGGIADIGTIFKYNITTKEYTRLIDFNWFSSGFFPFAKFIQAKDGNLYSVTSGGGLKQAGTIFRVNPYQEIPTISSYPFHPHEVQKLHEFDTLNGRRGYGLMAEVETGLLVGSTANGGVNDAGTIYSYNYITDEFQKRFDFGATNLGIIPNGDLIVGNNGNIYATLEQGGSQGRGSIFEFDLTDNSCKNLAELDSINGSRFDFGVMQASDGNIYAIASFGGANNLGTIVRLDLSTNQLTKVHDFSDSTGIVQDGVLLEASDGFLYGISRNGGRFGRGTLYQFDRINDTLRVVHHFEGSDGANPNGQLTELNGKLYGVCNEGGSRGTAAVGLIFEYDLSKDTLVELLPFDAREGLTWRPRLGVTVVDTCHQAFVSGLSTDTVVYCKGESITIKADKGTALNDANRWELLQASKSTNIIASGSSNQFSIVADSSSIYYLRSAGGCAPSKILDSIRIEVITIDTAINISQAVLSSPDTLATYQWLDCDSNFAAIAGATNRTYTAEKNGFYALELTKNGCVDTSSCKQIVSIGIEEISFGQGISLSPNPTTGALKIQLSENSVSVSLKLYNASGQLLQSSVSVAGRAIDLNIQSEAGIYYLQITNEEGEVANRKIVKQ